MTTTMTTATASTEDDPVCRLRELLAEHEAALAERTVARIRRDDARTKYVEAEAACAAAEGRHDRVEAAIRALFGSPPPSGENNGALLPPEPQDTPGHRERARVRRSPPVGVTAGGTLMAEAYVPLLGVPAVASPPPVPAAAERRDPSFDVDQVGDPDYEEDAAAPIPTPAADGEAWAREVRDPAEQAWRAGGSRRVVLKVNPKTQASYAVVALPSSGIFALHHSLTLGTSAQGIPWTGFSSEAEAKAAFLVDARRFYAGSPANSEKQNKDAEAMRRELDALDGAATVAPARGEPPPKPDKHLLEVTAQTVNRPGQAPVRTELAPSRAVAKGERCCRVCGVRESHRPGFADFTLCGTCVGFEPLGTHTVTAGTTDCMLSLWLHADGRAIARAPAPGTLGNWHDDGGPDVENVPAVADLLAALSPLCGGVQFDPDVLNVCMLDDDLTLVLELTPAVEHAKDVDGETLWVVACPKCDRRLEVRERIHKSVACNHCPGYPVMKPVGPKPVGETSSDPVVGGDYSNDEPPSVGGPPSNREIGVVEVAAGARGRLVMNAAGEYRLLIPPGFGNWDRDDLEPADYHPTLDVISAACTAASGVRLFGAEWDDWPEGPDGCNQFWLRCAPEDHPERWRTAPLRELLTTKWANLLSRAGMDSLGELAAYLQEGNKLTDVKGLTAKQVEGHGGLLHCLRDAWAKGTAEGQRGEWPAWLGPPGEEFTPPAEPEQPPAAPKKTKARQRRKKVTPETKLIDLTPEGAGRVMAASALGGCGLATVADLLAKAARTDRLVVDGQAYRGDSQAVYAALRTVLGLSAGDVLAIGDAVIDAGLVGAATHPCPECKATMTERAGGRWCRACGKGGHDALTRECVAEAQARLSAAAPRPRPLEEAEQGSLFGGTEIAPTAQSEGA